MPRPRQPGRHRRPEPLAAPEGAPALVLAIPGTPSSEVRYLVDEVVSIARSELPGLDIRTGYLESPEPAAAPEPEPAAETAEPAEAARSGEEERPEAPERRDELDGPGYFENLEERAPRRAAAPEEFGESFDYESLPVFTPRAEVEFPALADVLARAAREGQAARDGQERSQDVPDAVVVPLLAGPEPATFDRIREAVEASGAQVELTDALGPHPLLAEALHVRLSEVGLARADRARLFTVATAADGIILATVGGEEAVQAAGVTGLLLAARLAIPVLAAGLDVEGAIARTAEQLRTSGSGRLAIAPCVIGPELPQGLLAGAAESASCQTAEPLGAYPAVGRLVLSKYMTLLGIAPQQQNAPVH